MGKEFAIWHVRIDGDIEQRLFSLMRSRVFGNDNLLSNLLRRGYVHLLEGFGTV